MLKFNNEMTLAQRAGRNLDRELWKRNIKQVDFAKMIDRTPRTVRRWMYEGIPLLSDIELVAVALGVSARDILFGEEDVSSFFIQVQENFKIKILTAISKYGIIHIAKLT